MEENKNGQNGSDELKEVIHVNGMFESWFLDYASYVILERAVPAINDGLKPVQRRILHAMKEMDDGRFNKVANIIGNTMQYHPHGDASIGEAIIGLGQKDLLIETQGNWGDIRTGDGAAASRYIEARLSKFALEVVFNPQTTEWQLSYDGRKKEPVTFPVKFPLLLAQGVEGIAVGLSTKVLPHNFCELIEASIQVLKGKKPKIYPDFPTGGMMDASDYNDGLRGGKVRVRATIEELDKKTLVIRDIPFGITTVSLIESIIKANDKGKIKIKKVVDNTARDVEIQVQLAPNTSPDVTIDALYAFTDCEVSISPNTCVIVDDKPRFMGVSEILEANTWQTRDLLRRELEIKKAELLEKILFSSLEKIFIENRIYRDIEECETWEDVLDTIDRGLDPFKAQFYREITRDDIIRLTEIKIKRISRYDAFKADELLKSLEEQLKETEHHLAHLTEYAISYYQRLLEKFGKGRERKSVITSFESIEATMVVANNQKLYVNREDGFIGFGIKKDEYIMDCSDIDDIIVFRRDGKCVVTRITDKTFVGKDIIYASVWKKNDERTVYNLAYLDGSSGRTMVKRFQVLSVTRDKEYAVGTDHPKTRVLWFTANANAEAEMINIQLTSGSKARKKVFDFDFAELEIKGRGAKGNILTRYPVRKITLKSEGVSTLGGLKLWYDETIGRLNTDARGNYVGEFSGEDTILVLHRNGSYELTNYDLTNRYDPKSVLYLTKMADNIVVNAVYQDGESKNYYIKRFKIETTTLDKPFLYISENKGSKLIAAAPFEHAKMLISYQDRNEKKEEEVIASDLIDIKGWKAIGNKFQYGNRLNKVEFIALESTKNDENEDTNDEGDEDTFDVGSTIDLSPGDDSKDQLGLF